MVLIQVEGTDRVGKTTVAKILYKELKEASISAKVLAFPNRETEIGNIVDKMLKKKKFEWNEAVIFQLLQTANRLEFYQETKKWQKKGDSVLIFDRYALSGLVYGKLDGVPYDFLMSLQLLLPPPQLSIILTADKESLERRLKQKMQLEIYEKIEKILEVQEQYIKISKEYEQNVRQKLSFKTKTLILDNSDKKLKNVVKKAKNEILRLLSK